MKTNTEIDPIITVVNPEEWTATFINNDIAPYKSEPQNHFEYIVVENGKTHFSQLYKHSFLYKGAVIYNILRWEKISVKRHCEQALKNIIDAGKAVEEFKL